MDVCVVLVPSRDVSMVVGAFAFGRGQPFQVPLADHARRGDVANWVLPVIDRANDRPTTPRWVDDSVVVRGEFPVCVQDGAELVGPVREVEEREVASNGGREAFKAIKLRRVNAYVLVQFCGDNVGVVFAVLLRCSTKYPVAGVSHLFLSFNVSVFVSFVPVRSRGV